MTEIDLEVVDLPKDIDDKINMLKHIPDPDVISSIVKTEMYVAERKGYESGKYVGKIKLLIMFLIGFGVASVGVYLL